MQAITPFQSSIFLTNIEESILKDIEIKLLNMFNITDKFKYQVFNLEKNKEFNELSNNIKQELNKTFKYLKIKYDDIEINNMWANYSKDMYYHSKHIHPNSFFSGIIYIKASENAAPTSFYNPLTESSMIQPDFEEDYEYVPELTTTYDLYAKAGNMVLFPSNLPHGVNHTPADNQERITLAFTAMPKGIISTTTQEISF
jgi:uncharacterized protein (TIGR02466 family)